MFYVENKNIKTLSIPESINQLPSKKKKKIINPYNPQNKFYCTSISHHPIASLNCTPILHKYIL